MSGGAAKYVKFRHWTLLFCAKHIGSDCESGKRSRGLSSTLGGNRDARAVRCSGLMGFSGLRFGLLGVFESCFVVIVAMKLGGAAMRFGHRA